MSKQHLLGRTTCVLVGLLLVSQADVGRGQSSKVWDFLAEKYDQNGDGQLSPDEYDRGADAFARLDRNGDGVLTEVDWQVAGAFPKYTFPHIAPKKGDPAPDFALIYIKAPKKVARLSSFVGKKPVALIFGSCT